MVTLQQLLDAQRTVQFGESGQAATIINPLTGQREIAEIGLTAPGYDGQTHLTSFMVPASLASEAAGLPGVGRIPNQHGPFVSTYTNDGFLANNADLLKFAGIVGGANALGGALGAFGPGAGGSSGSFLDSLPGMTQSAAPIVEGSGLGSLGGAAAGYVPEAAILQQAVPGALEGAISGLPAGLPFFPGPTTGGGSDPGFQIGEQAGGGLGNLPYGAAGTATAGLSLGAGLAAGGSGGAAGGATSLANLLGLTGAAGTAVDAFGRAIPGLVGAYASNQQADALRGIYDTARGDRAPFLAKANSLLAGGPEAYGAGDGMGSLNATLRALSAQHGNPISSPTALGIATDAGLRNWQNAVSGFGNLGLAGEDTQARLATNAVGADANVWNSLGASAGNIFSPPSTLEQLLKQMKGAGLGLGSLTG